MSRFLYDDDGFIEAEVFGYDADGFPFGRDLRRADHQADDTEAPGPDDAEPSAADRAEWDRLTRDRPDRPSAAELAEVTSWPSDPL